MPGRARTCSSCCTRLVPAHCCLFLKQATERWIDASPTRDDVLDNVSLYWLTNTAASAGRIYWENHGAQPTSAAAR